MRPLLEAALEPGGIPGDKHFEPGSPGELLLIERETLDDLRLDPGAVKENFTIEGISLMSLAEGTRVAMGDAVVEITERAQPCSNMDDVRQGLREQLKGRRGMLARVVGAGHVGIGDPVSVVEEANGPPP